MRILIQMGWERLGRSVSASAPPVAMALALFCGAGSVEAQTGEIRCSVTENGGPARGTIVVEQNGREVGGGSCGSPLSVPVGKCKVTVRLDGTLDNPAKRVDVEVSASKPASVSVDFQTGVLEVRIETKEQGGTGLVTVNRGSKRIGTLGSGVTAHLTVGTYEVIVRLGGEERRYAVDLRPGQHRMVRAQF